MFDILIRELAARFGTGDKSSDLLRIVLAYMTNKETGGLMGFLERFKAAGLGPLVQSWLGNTVSAKPLNNTQVETVLGGPGGLLELLSHHTDAPRDNLAGAVAYLIPSLVAKLTPGGSMPGSLPEAVTSFMGDTKALLTLPADSVAAAGAGGGLTKWLPWLIGAVVLLLGLSYCSKKGDAPPPADAPAQTAPASDAAVEPAGSASDAALGAAAPAADAASAADAAAAGTPAADASAAAPAADGAVVLASLPEGAAVVAGEAHGVPLLQVFFDSGKVDVAAEFAAKAATLVDYLKANPGAQAVVSGFNDPTGDPAKNAELSKQRAQAVRAALVAQGIDETRTVLEKPVDTTGTAVSNAAARRVDVVVRP